MNNKNIIIKKNMFIISTSDNNQKEKEWFNMIYTSLSNKKLKEMLVHKFNAILNEQMEYNQKYNLIIENKYKKINKFLSLFRHWLGIGFLILKWKWFINLFYPKYKFDSLNYFVFKELYLKIENELPDRSWWIDFELYEKLK